MCSVSFANLYRHNNLHISGMKPDATRFSSVINMNKRRKKISLDILSLGRDIILCKNIRLRLSISDERG